MRLGDLLRCWRLIREVTTRDAAKMIGTTAPTICRIEAGKPVDGATLAKVLKWLMEPNPKLTLDAPSASVRSEETP